MNLVHLHRDRYLLLAVVLAGGAFLGGTIAATHTASERLIKEDSARTAVAWVRHASENIPELAAILGGTKPSPESLSVLASARGVGDVFRYRLYGPDGRLVLASDPSHVHSLKATPRPAGQSFQQAALQGSVVVDLQDGTEPGEPALYSEISVPVVKGSTVQGVMELHIDQTNRAAVFRARFNKLTGLLALLMGLAVSLPAVVIWRKIRERHEAEAQIRHLAHHDPLTGLPNRARFADDVRRGLAIAAANQAGVAMLCIDLDRFKEVNDTLGHAAGDALLRTVAQRLRENVRQVDAVARLGGDEFAVLQVGLEQPINARILARRLVDVLSRPAEIEGHHVFPGVSIGLAVFPADGADGDELMRSADLALYRAKSEGRGGYRSFEPGMDAAIVARRKLEAELRQAVTQEQLELHYQPQIDLESGATNGYEALVRWRHPTRGLVGPDAFVPLAEDTGMIGPLGEWVLKRACRDALDWPQNQKVSVNLSPMQFKSGDVVATVERALAESGLIPHRLELEITEGLLLERTDAVFTTLERLKALGVSIAMDDFGTGYSSLAYLWRFPFNKIKIDRSFIRHLDDDPNVEAIVGAIVSLGRRLGMTVTAEGVEAERQADFLRDQRCHEAQGYLFGRPQPRAPRDVPPEAYSTDASVTPELREAETVG